MTPPLLTADAYRELLAMTPAPVLVHDEHGRVVEANEAFAELLGYTLPEALRLDAASVVHPGDRAVRDADAARLFRGDVVRLATERRLVTRHGSVLRVRARKAGAEIDGRRLVMVILEDWTDDYAMTEELRHAVYTDDLTGVLNRRGVWRHLDQLEPDDLPQVLALLGVDHLKATNDGIGLAAGDVVLRTVASRLEGVVGPGAVVARLSGDDFLVLAPTTTWTEQTLLAAIAERVAGTVQTDDRTRLPIDLRVGTATLADAEDFTAALARAEQAQRAADLAG